MKNLTTLKTLGEKVLLTMEHFFFQNSKLHNGIALSVSRGSRQRSSIRKGVLRNLTNFTGKYLYQESLFYQKIPENT